MTDAWAICPVCKKMLAVEVVDVPRQPMALLRHLEEAHGPGPVPSERRESVRAQATPAPPPPPPDDHPPRRAASPRPHGRPRH